MGRVKKTANNKCWLGCGKKGSVVHCWWACKLLQPLWKTVWGVLKKLKIELPYDPEVPTTGYISEENENTDSKRYAPQWS